MLVKEAGGAVAGAGGPARPAMLAAVTVPVVAAITIIPDDAKAAKPPMDADGPADAEAASRDARKLHRRAVRRQFLACVAVLFLYLMTGVCMGYSSSLIPALEAADSEIPVTRKQSAWLASLFVLCVPLGAMLAMALNNVLGRLAIVRAMVLPYLAGWALIATASSFEQLLVGRVVTGISVGMSHSPSLLFVAEVANPYIRGGLGTFATALASSGIVMSYVLGAYLPWRTHAWANCAVPVLPLALQWAFATESPVWLRARGRAEAAASASTYYYNDANKVLSSPSQRGAKDEADFWRPLRLLFTTPAGLKPLVIINVVFVIQQLIGVYVTIYYAVTFFAETGSTIDPYIASILIGVVRFVGCTSVSLVMPRLGRRPLMTVSSLGQAVAMAVSAYASMRILEDPESMSSTWVVGAVLTYILFGCLGWQTIPWSMMPELFSHEVRSLAQPLNTSTAHLLMFAMLQLYPTLSDLLGGAVGIQFLFAVMSALAAVFVLVFLPETRNRTLQDIETYFENNVIFITEKRRRRAARRAAAQAALAGKPI